MKSNDLPDGWRLLALEDCSEVILGQSPPGSTYNDVGEGIPFFQGKAEFGSLYPTTDRWCSEPKKIAEEGDVLISMRAPVGPTNLARERCCIGRGLAAIRPSESITTTYLLYALRSLEDEIASKGTGSTFSAITGKTLRSIKIPVAPRREQDEIVSLLDANLSRLTQARRVLGRTEANLARYRASVLQAACEGRLVPTEAELARREGRGYESADELLDRILAERRARWEAEELEKLKAKGMEPKDDRWKKKYKEPEGPDTSELAELPDGWVWASVAQLGEVVTGTTPSTKEDKYYGGELPFVKPTDLEQGRNIQTARSFLTPMGAEQGRVLPPQSVLVTCIGATIGKLGMNVARCATNQQINALVPPPISDLPTYAYWYLASPAGQRAIMEGASATTLPILNKTNFSRLPVPIPPLDELKRIVQALDELTTYEETIRHTVAGSLKRASALRKGLLKKAFTGRLRRVASSA